VSDSDPLAGVGIGHWSLKSVRRLDVLQAPTARVIRRRWQRLQRRLSWPALFDAGVWRARETDRLPFGALRRPSFVCHEKQVSVRKTQRVEAFRPHLPFFLLGRTGRPLVSVHREGKAAIGYSSRRLASAAGELLLERGAHAIGVLSVSTAERLEQVVSQLNRHDVEYLIWDDVGDSASRRVFHLELAPARTKGLDPSGLPSATDRADSRTPADPAP
jgi:hypothetical protein